MKLFNKKIFSKDELKKLSSSIAEAERNTAGEIRVVIRHRRQWSERKLSLRDLAVREFFKLGMQHTRDRTGILILLLVSERQFDIIADEGINEKVEADRWEKIASSMSKYFREGKFLLGITEAINTVGMELSKHFPRKPDDTNELPNEVIER